jgi:DNA modification methylase
MKPIALWAQAVEDGSHGGEFIYDPFLGSGTTLIAAEQLGRICYGMEISPAYCDVIVKRWETLTGQKATRERP